MSQEPGMLGSQLHDGLPRRDFLRLCSAGASALGLGSFAQADSAGDDRGMNCIVLFLVGGPSQLETWDLKPDAPEAIRGPFRPIHTSVPGIHICEHLPRMAKLAHQYAILRSVFHDSAPVHETGQQLMQTGRLSVGGVEHPHYGAVLAECRQLPIAPPSSVILPGAIGNTGLNTGHGQSAGHLAPHRAPVFADAIGDTSTSPLPPGLPGEGLGERGFTNVAEALELAREPLTLRARYGTTPFGENCLKARRLIERGVRFVTVNMFQTVFNQVTWDCHADHGGLSTTLQDYRKTLLPMFDLAYSALLTDLIERGLFRSTMVWAMGEFGRTPSVNNRGGRDHHPGVWSVVAAGGRIRGGQVIGASDKHGAVPADRPVHPSEIVASVYHGHGLDPRTSLPAADGQPFPLAEAKPIHELFGH
jgi:uncharacterized protein (DUF1501 family)